MKTYLNALSPPQSQPLIGRDMVQNNAGGYVFKLDPFAQLERFLILGSDAPTYYCTAQKLTLENARVVAACLHLSPQRTVDKIVEISTSGRAPKNDPAIFALAMASSAQFSTTPSIALDAVEKVCRIGTDFLHYVQFVDQVRGWGVALRRTLNEWMLNKSADDLAYQMCKYQQRDGWSMRDVLRKTRPKITNPPKNSVVRWVVRKELTPDAPAIIRAVAVINSATTEKEVCQLIGEYKLSWEMVPTQWLTSPAVWEALLPHMPPLAMIRSLGRMGATKLLTPFSNAEKMVLEKLNNHANLAAKHIHPLRLLLAQHQYANGQGQFRSTWEVCPQVTAALEDAFYASFGWTQPTGANIYIGLDVSGSMGALMMNTPLSCAQASAAMALTIAKTEKSFCCYGFSTTMRNIPLTKHSNLADAHRMAYMPFGGTDCSLPMIHAAAEQWPIDAFIIFTDNETWAGRIHPMKALVEFRQKMNKPNAKLIVVGLTSTGFTIADPSDANTLDVVGFDGGMMELITTFIRGKS